jgi:antitoxin ParD1/3/4
MPDPEPTGDSAGLTALRNAVDRGIAAIERGEYREFVRMDDLIAYLDKVAEQAIGAATRR